MQFEARPVAPPLRPGFPPQYRGMRPPYIVPGNDPDDELLDARRRHAEQSNAAVERARQKREEDDRKLVQSNYSCITKTDEVRGPDGDFSV